MLQAIASLIPSKHYLAQTLEVFPSPSLPEQPGTTARKLCSATCMCAEKLWSPCQARSLPCFLPLPSVPSFPRTLPVPRCPPASMALPPCPPQGNPTAACLAALTPSLPRAQGAPRPARGGGGVTIPMRTNWTWHSAPWSG